MTLALLLLLLLVLVACVSLHTGHRRVGRTIAGVAIVLLLLSGCGPLPHWLLLQIQPSPVAASAEVDWSAAPAIVVIGAGLADVPGHDAPTLPVWTGGRLLRAAELYAQCAEARPHCIVVLSGGGPGRTGVVTEADLMAEQLVRLGVARGDLVLERESQNTWQNAEYTAPLLAEHAIQGRPLLLTSAIHASRADAYFLAAGVDVQSIPTDHLAVEMTWVPSALNLAITDLALHELVGQARLSIYSALGLNE